MVNTLTFNLQNLASENIDDSHRVKISPVYSPIVSGSYIFTSDPKEKVLDSDGVCAFTNIVPNLYEVQVLTDKIVTEFNLLIDNNDTGSINATDCLVGNVDDQDTQLNAYVLTNIPTSLTASGKIGNIAFDSASIYIYGSTGWYTASVSSFGS